jgi:hypothetical protein
MLETKILLEMLVGQGDRLPELMNWLYAQVWSPERMLNLGPEEYLVDGEKAVAKLEDLILAAAPGLYDDLAARVQRAKSVLQIFNQEQSTALVIFDGLSIRELPFIEKLAAQTAYHIVKRGYGFAALPSETVDFIEQRMLGKAVAPAELHHRKELQQNGIKSYYYDSPIKSYPLSAEDTKLILWSQFPDNTFKDMGSRFSSHFATMQTLFDQVWKNIIMMVPRGFRIIVTSDHGYVYFGVGMDSNLPSDAARHLDQARNRIFSAYEPLPPDIQDLQIVAEKRLVMLRGRIKNRPQGPAAANAYRHGGFSIMEMLTPWLVLERK